MTARCRPKTPRCNAFTHALCLCVGSSITRPRRESARQPVNGIIAPAKVAAAHLRQLRAGPWRRVQHQAAARTRAQQRPRAAATAAPGPSAPAAVLQQQAQPGPAPLPLRAVPAPWRRCAHSALRAPPRAAAAAHPTPVALPSTPPHRAAPPRTPRASQAPRPARPLACGAGSERATLKRGQKGTNAPFEGDFEVGGLAQAHVVPLRQPAGQQRASRGRWRVACASGRGKSGAQPQP